MEHLPVRIEFVDTPEKVEELLPTLYDMVTDGMIDVQDTTVVKVARKERRPEPKAPNLRKKDPPDSCASSWAKATSGTVNHCTR